ncbi:MAG: hypothetical protein ACT4OM_13085 [Actinomycetota bacterium]
MDLLAWPNAGLTTAKDLLGVCVELGFTAVIRTRFPYGDQNLEREEQAPAAPDFDGSLGTSNAVTPIDMYPPALAKVVPLVQLLSAWATQERGLSQLGELIALSSSIAGPPEVVDALKSLAEIELASLVTTEFQIGDLNELTARLLDDLEAARRLVYRRRHLDGDRPTLETVGLEMGITRERVRQLQVLAEKDISETLARDDYRTFRWRAWGLRNTLGAEAPINHPECEAAIEVALRGSNEDTKQILRPLFLRMAGPYREKEGWLINQSLPQVEAKELATIADNRGLITLTEAEAWLLEREVRPPFQKDWILRSKRFRCSDEKLLVWAGGAIDKCVTLLASEGHPMDAETLVGLIGEGHNARGIRARLFEDPRLMRVNRTLWALREWDMEEYSGITEEIAQRIHEWGGRAKLSELVNELVPLFGVRETSVRVYAQAPMFVIEDGWVRLRTLDEPYAPRTELSRCRGVFRTSGGVNVLFLIDGDVTRGSGRPFPDAAAVLLGVTPGNRREFEHDSGAIVISWPVTAGLGPTVGSTRKLAEAAGAVEGDYVRLAFISELGTVEVARVAPEEMSNQAPFDSLRLICGIEGDSSLEPALAFAVGVAPTAVRRTLKNRGDELVAGLLPDGQMDEGLEAALEDFARLIDGSL